GSSSNQKKPSPPAFSNPPNPKPVTGKRSRDDGKDVSTSESQREAATESSPVPPPAKRVKTAPEPSSLAQNQKKNAILNRNSTVQSSKASVSKQVDDQLPDNRKKNKGEGICRDGDRISTDTLLSNDVRRVRSTRSDGSEIASGTGRSASPSVANSDSSSAKHSETKKATTTSKNAEGKASGENDVLEREIQRRKNKPNRKSQVNPNIDNPEGQNPVRVDVQDDRSDNLTGNKTSKASSSDTNSKSLRTETSSESKKPGESNKAKRVETIIKPMITSAPSILQANAAFDYPRSTPFDLHLAWVWYSFGFLDDLPDFARDHDS
ncbi:14904_t:CDS:2, partial [Acaulospora colombiana]